MKITQAIEFLLALQRKHGDTDVYFDCPHCGKSSKPTTAVPVVMVNGAKE
jgi:transcription elongation factor Elf1